MRAWLTIFASLTWQGAGLPFSPAVSDAGIPPESSCCCCCDSTGGCGCDCGCASPAQDRNEQGPPDRLLCTCDDLPAAEAPAGHYQAQQPRRPVLPAFRFRPRWGDQPSYVTEVRDIAHRPPPDLSCIRTFILLT